MGYRDKAWVNYNGRPLVHHVIDVLAPQVGQIIVSQNSDHPGWRDIGLTSVADEQSLGPLSGVLTCSRGITTNWTVVVPCDIPNLPGDLVERLTHCMGDADLAVARDDHGQQNLVFLARTQSLASIKAYLDQGKRSVHRWIQSRSFSTVPFQRTFENINEHTQLTHNRVEKKSEE